MKLTAEDFQRRYGELSNEGLLAIDRGDLTETARAVYDAELSRRKLALPAPPETAAVPRPPQEPDELVQVATFLYPMEAKFARAELEGEEIPCFLDNERTIDVDWFLSNLLGGYRLRVPASYADRAREILDTRISDEELAAQAEAAELPADEDTRSPQ